MATEDRWAELRSLVHEMATASDEFAWMVTQEVPALLAERDALYELITRVEWALGQDGATREGVRDTIRRRVAHIKAANTDRTPTLTLPLEGEGSRSPAR